jgi:phosphoserine aminotransferase
VEIHKIHEINTAIFSDICLNVKCDYNIFLWNYGAVFVFPHIWFNMLREWMSLYLIHSFWYYVLAKSSKNVKHAKQTAVSRRLVYWSEVGVRMNAWTCWTDAKTQLFVGSCQTRLRPYNGSLPRHIAQCKFPVFAYKSLC